MKFPSGSSDRSSESISKAGIFLGGPAGAGKTALASYLYSQGWNSLDMDKADKSNKVLELLDAPADHPAFQRRPLVVEGGFLEEAPRFQRLVDRLELTTFWLTGTKEQLTKSRLRRRAHWDDVNHIKTTDWLGLIEKYRKFVRWDYEIQMWQANGQRKTFDQVEYEILGCLVTGVHRTASW
jgi:hypothetical protein